MSSSEYDELLNDLYAKVEAKKKLVRRCGV